MKYELVLSGKFKKGLKPAKKRGLDISLLNSIVDKLLQGIPLEEKYQDHSLKGNWKRQAISAVIYLQFLSALADLRSLFPAQKPPQKRKSVCLLLRKSSPVPRH